jgi:peptide/nickel transport system ATP-binding protein
MYAGRIVETAPTKAIFDRPSHPYTAGLMNSLPHRQAGDRLRPIPGQPPSLAGLGATCPFVERCAVASVDCATTPIALAPVAPGHTTACLHPERTAAMAA